MSIKSKSKRQPGKNSNQPVYLQRFVKDVHRLVVAGYKRIDPRKQCRTDERQITERLVVAINEVIREASAPSGWSATTQQTTGR